MSHDPSRRTIARVLDACAAYQHGELDEAALSGTIARNADALRAIDPDTARVLASFVTVLDAIAPDERPGRPRAPVCAVLDRIRDFARFRDPAVEPAEAT